MSARSEEVSCPARPPRRVWWLLAWTLVLSPWCGRGATITGDIKLTRQAWFNGPTYHGYFAHQFLIENTSPDRPRTIRLELPYTVYGHGSGLRELARTVKVGPGATASVTLWQPALPISGDMRVRVIVDGRERESVAAIAGNTHAEPYSSAAGRHRVILVSRSLNSDDLDKKLKGGLPASVIPNVPYSPLKATGPANSGLGQGFASESWMPERINAGMEWLEVEFPSAILPAGIQIYPRGNRCPVTELRLMDAAGAELASVTVTNAPQTAPRPPPPFFEVRFPPLTNAVRRVRINLNTSGNPLPVSIDAVKLFNSATALWAATALASSSYASRTGGSRGTSAVEQSPTVLRAELEAAEWGEQWLNYTPIDVILMSTADLRAMPGAARNTLWRAVQTGSALMVLGTVELPPGAVLESGSPAAGVKRYRVGFGQCLSVDNATTATLSEAQLTFLRDLCQENAQVWQSLPDESSANTEFPVVEDDQVPVRGIVFIMLLFIGVVGPLNIFLLARRDRRIWMLWTIPGVSFLTCALVFAWSLFSEGITPTVRLLGLTWLDQETHQAATLGRAAFYCPLTPGDGLRFPSEMEVTPLVRTSGHAQRGAAREVDWTREQHFTRGWIMARVPAHFAVRKIETRRERLQLEREPDGRLAVVNGLGVKISALTLADSAGRVYSGSDLLAGQKSVLAARPDPLPRDNPVNVLSGIFLKGFTPESIAALRKDPERHLQPGAYVAVVEGMPFLEMPLRGTVKATIESVIYGRLAPGEGK